MRTYIKQPPSITLHMRDGDSLVIPLKDDYYFEDMDAFIRRASKIVHLLERQHHQSRQTSPQTIQQETEEQIEIDTTEKSQTLPAIKAGVYNASTRRQQPILHYLNQQEWNILIIDNPRRGELVKLCQAIASQKNIPFHTLRQAVCAARMNRSKNAIEHYKLQSKKTIDKKTIDKKQ